MLPGCSHLKCGHKVRELYIDEHPTSQLSKKTGTSTCWKLSQQMTPLNALSSLEHSPTQLGANNPCIPAEDPCTRQPRLPTGTWIHTQKFPQKTTKQKNQTKRTSTGIVVAGLRPNNATWPVCRQLCSPDTDGRAKLCSPLSTPEELKKKMFIAITHVALFTSWEAMNV